MQSELALGYLDDFSLGGEADDVARDFITLETRAEELGLTLNRTKCEVIGQTASTRAQLAANGVDLREVELKDAMLLGSPLLPGVGVNEVIAAKIEELQTLCVCVISFTTIRSWALISRSIRSWALISRSRADCH